jgi:hypothetical protein
VYGVFHFLATGNWHNVFMGSAYASAAAMHSLGLFRFTATGYKAWHFKARLQGILSQVGKRFSAHLHYFFLIQVFFKFRIRLFLFAFIKGLFVYYTPYLFQRETLLSTSSSLFVLRKESSSLLNSLCDSS